MISSFLSRFNYFGETMGRIKTMLIKRTSNLLVKEYPDKFTKDFDENKKKVEGLVDVSSKKLRNIIAGYVTRLTKSKDKE